MALPYTFATQPGGNVPALYLDTNYTFLQAQGVQRITATGSAGTYVATPADALVSSYSNYKNAGYIITFPANNPGPSTINFSGLGAINLYKYKSNTASVALVANDIVAGIPYFVSLDGTNAYIYVADAASGDNTDIASLSGLSDGSAATPSVAFSGDTNTGFYRIGSDDLGASAGGITAFRITGVGGTAVNYLGVINAATGTGAALAVYGSDTNIAIRYISKGTGSQDFYTNGGTQQFAIIHTASAVNYARFTGGSAGNKVTMDVAGSDTNIGFTISLKGTGDLQCGNVNSNTTASAANVNVDGSGNLRRSTSSLKYKKDITDYDKGLSVIGQLRPVYYKPKAIGDERTLAGFIAEDLHDLGLSEFVEYRDGEPDGIFYPYLTALLVKGMKELKARVEALEAAQ